MKVKLKDKAKYKEVYDFVKENGCPRNMEGVLVSIDPAWKGQNGIIFDDDIDQAYLDVFITEMARTFHWPNPLTGEKEYVPARRHGLLWWLLIGWWWSIVKVIFKLLTLGLKNT